MGGFDFSSFLGGLGEAANKKAIADQQHQTNLEMHKYDLAQKTAQLWQSASDPALQSLGGKFAQLLYAHTGKPGYVDKIGGQVWKEYQQIPKQSSPDIQFPQEQMPPQTQVPQKLASVQYTDTGIPGVGPVPSGGTAAPAFEPRPFMPLPVPPGKDRIKADAQTGELDPASKLAIQEYYRQRDRAEKYNEDIAEKNETMADRHRNVQEYMRTVPAEEQDSEEVRKDVSRILQGQSTLQSLRSLMPKKVGNQTIGDQNYAIMYNPQDPNNPIKIPVDAPAASTGSLQKIYYGILKKQGVPDQQAAERALSFTQRFGYDMNNKNPSPEAVRAATNTVELDPTTWNMFSSNKKLADGMREMMASDKTIPIKLTAAFRQLGETAKSLIPKMNDVLKNLDDPKYAGEMGVALSKWNEFMAGKVGTASKEYAYLRTVGSLMQTGLMRAHVGARGGSQLLAKFEGMLAVGNMDVETFKEAVKTARDFIDGYREQLDNPQARQPGKQVVKLQNAEQLKIEQDLVAKYAKRKKPQSKE